MKKTIGIICILLMTVFVGVFTASRIHRKMQAKNAPANVVSTPAQPGIPPETPTVVKETPKVVFYTSVGGSSPNDIGSVKPSRISTRYTIELGTLKSQKEAEALLLQLKAKGIDGFYTPTRRGGIVYYHVRLGLFSNTDDAEQNLKKIATRVNVNGRVTKLN